MASTILIHLMASMVFTTLFSGATDALIGYDCGRKSAPNITTISLRHVELTEMMFGVAEKVNLF
ncbi:uncharacterized protein LOC116417792 isoform X2 [Nasonia vitripennis]|uniref:Uncharacterized protein n=1 Tax=Nasonia vitripennis TaxID=7425 RepID=A0A7M7TB73_NASVI|nr:uncharacterized protein LOC116417792 isoform X2 [Nasonia vitripennis]